MNRFIESIRCFNGKLENLAYHQRRVDEVFSTFFSYASRLQLDNIIIPSDCQKGCFKCRFVYGTSIEKLCFLPYEVKPIRSLQLVTDNHCNYDYKFEDRTEIARLYAHRENADDILILKNGKITDSSYANIAFFDGQNWLSPAAPLLRGTRRQSLIDQGIIKEYDITVDHLKHYVSVRLFNAMIPFEEAVILPITSIQK